MVALQQLLEPSVLMLAGRGGYSRPSTGHRDCFLSPQFLACPPRRTSVHILWHTSGIILGVAPIDAAS